MLRDSLLKNPFGSINFGSTQERLAADAMNQADLHIDHYALPLHF